MRIYVALTDNDWFRFLASRINYAEDEVNFWRPTPQAIRMQNGDLFLFKLHRSPEIGQRDVIAGGGIFVSYSELPISLAWTIFGERNGCSSYMEMRQKIASYRGKIDDPREDFKIGCIVLSEVFFFPPELWINVPSWKPGIQVGKFYDPNSSEWHYLLENLQLAWNAQKYDYLSRETARVKEERARYGKETIIRPRLGQRGFRIVVTESYRRACAITTEHSLPALEAAHIKPFSLSGPHEVYNGILLRSDFHKLMDSGYITITPEYRVEVSRKLKEDFENGKTYYPYHGKPLLILPNRPEDRPSRELLIWHNENVFKG